MAAEAKEQKEDPNERYIRESEDLQYAPLSRHYNLILKRINDSYRQDDKDLAILDVGCGAGYMIKFFCQNLFLLNKNHKNQQFHYIGVDIDKSRLEYAKQLKHVPAKDMENKNIKFEFGVNSEKSLHLDPKSVQADFIFISFVFNFLNKDYKSHLFKNEMMSLLKDNGKIVILDYSQKFCDSMFAEDGTCDADDNQNNNNTEDKTTDKSTENDNGDETDEYFFKCSNQDEIIKFMNDNGFCLSNNGDILKNETQNKQTIQEVCFTL